MIINYDWANAKPEPYWIMEGILEFGWVGGMPYINIDVLPSTIVIQLTALGVKEISNTDNIGGLQPIVDNRVSIVINGITYKICPFGEAGKSQMINHSNGVITLKIIS